MLPGGLDILIWSCNPINLCSSRICCSRRNHKESRSTNTWTPNEWLWFGLGISGICPPCVRTSKNGDSRKPSSVLIPSLDHNNTNVLMEIKDVKFPFLRFINVRDCQIESVEGICRIWMPILDDLYISSHLFIQSKTASWAWLPSRKLTGQTWIS